MTRTWGHLRNPEPNGAFVAYVCDVLQDYAKGDRELDIETHNEFVKRCKPLKLDGLHVWNNLVALAHSLPRANARKG